MRGRVPYILLIALLLSALAFIDGREVKAMKTSEPLSMLPRNLAGWYSLGDEIFDAEIIDVLKPTDYVARTYAKSAGERVNLYLGYHGGGKGSGEVHSPRHCLPGAGWQHVETKPVVIETAAGSINAAAALYARNESRQLFLYWFEVGGTTTPNEYRMKYEQTVGTLAKGRKDVLFVRLAVPVATTVDSATAAASGFAKDAAPLIRRLLPPWGG